jgi:hypothetical protein
MREIEDCRRDLCDLSSCEARDRDKRRLLFIVLWSSSALRLRPTFLDHEHERSSRIHIRVPDASVFVPHMFQLSLSVPSFFPL